MRSEEEKLKDRVKALEYQVYNLRRLAGNLPLCDECGKPADSYEDLGIIDDCGGCIKCWKDDE